jgi:hypothetical protein
VALISPLEVGLALRKLMNDGFVKSPSAALRFIFRHCDVPYVRLIPQASRALHLELFTVPSVCGLFTSPS